MPTEAALLDHEFERGMFPYFSTAQEVIEQYDLTRKQLTQVKQKALKEAACPWFSKHVYTLLHRVCAEVTNGN